MTFEELDELQGLSKSHPTADEKLRYALLLVERAPELLLLAEETLEARESFSRRSRRRGRERSSYLEVPHGLRLALESYMQEHGLPGWAAAARGILSRETRKG